MITITIYNDDDDDNNDEDDVTFALLCIHG